MICRLAAVAAGWLALCAGAAQAEVRVAALDQCADQYVIAMAPRDQIVGVTPRADDYDAWLRRDAAGLPVRRPTLESMLAAQPNVVVRYWGGDARMMRALERRGVRVVQIEEATTFPELRANVLRVADELGQPEAGRRLAARIDADLAAAKGAWRGRRAMYMTPSGFTAGAGTLTDAVLRAAGLTNSASSPGFSAVSLERLVFNPPELVVRAFYEAVRSDRRGTGRSRVMARVSRGRVVAELPGSLLSCPAWFATAASRRLAERAPR